MAALTIPVCATRWGPGRTSGHLLGFGFDCLHWDGYYSLAVGWLPALVIGGAIVPEGFCVAGYIGPLNISIGVRRGRPGFKLTAFNRHLLVGWRRHPDGSA